MLVCSCIIELKRVLSDLNTFRQIRFLFSTQQLNSTIVGPDDKIMYVICINKIDFNRFSHA